jgi:hypothetical protein
MRIHTLIGPRLQQEIVRSTTVAIALSNFDPTVAAVTAFRRGPFHVPVDR